MPLYKKRRKRQEDLSHFRTTQKKKDQDAKIVLVSLLPSSGVQGAYKHASLFAYEKVEICVWSVLFISFQ